MNYKIISILFLASVVSGLAHGQPLTLKQCLELAEKASVGLRISEMETEKAAIIKGTAFDVSNTEVELTQSSTEGGGVMDNGLRFSQEFEFPSIYVARHKVYSARQEVAQSEYDRNLINLRGQVTETYYALLLALNKIKVIENALPQLQKFADISGIRLKEGEASRLEVLNARRMLSKTEMTLANARIEKEAAALRLAQLTGVERQVEIEEQDLSPLDAGFVSEGFILSTSPDSQVALARFSQASRMLSLSRQEFAPSFSVSATSQLLLKGFNPYHVQRDRFAKGDFMGFSVGISVPLFFGAKRARMLAAKRDVMMADLKVLEENIRVETEYSVLVSKLEGFRSNIDYYVREGMPQADEMLRLSAISYELGEIDYLEYMQNIDSVLSTKLDYLECVNQMNQTIIKLQTLRGTI